jgi:peroxiredoxin
LLALAMAHTYAEPATQPMQADIPALLSDDDTASTAFEKIKTTPPRDSTTAIQYQTACRDFCERFPEDSHYFAVRRLSAAYWGIFSRYTDGRIANWNPLDAERDPRLDAEQKADVAMLIANGRVIQKMRYRQVPFSHALFDAVVAAVPAHKDTQTARKALIRAALAVPPEKALPKLRELYPDDAEVGKCIALLEAIGKPCDFKFTALNGKPVDSKAYKGKVVVLVFWAKSSAPFLAGLPELLDMADRLNTRGFEVVGVNMDTKREDAQDVISQSSLPWPQYFDGKGWKSELAERFLVTTLPHFVALDRKGNLRVMGDLPTERISTFQIEALLNEAP